MPQPVPIIVPLALWHTKTSGTIWLALSFAWRMALSFCARLSLSSEDAGTVTIEGCVKELRHPLLATAVSRLLRVPFIALFRYKFKVFAICCLPACNYHISPSRILAGTINRLIHRFCSPGGTRYGEGVGFSCSSYSSSTGPSLCRHSFGRLLRGGLLLRTLVPSLLACTLGLIFVCYECK